MGSKRRTNDDDPMFPYTCVVTGYQSRHRRVTLRNNCVMTQPREGDHRSLSPGRPGLEDQPSAVERHDAVSERQSQANAAGPGAREGMEEPFAKLLGHART